MVDAHEQRRSAVAAVLARSIPRAAADVPLAMAREILDVLPDLHLLDDARRSCSMMEERIELVRAELDRRPWLVDLPPPGTLLGEALLDEARSMRQKTATMTGGHAAGFAAGRDAFIRALESRAATVAPDPRPGVTDDSSAPVLPDDRPNNVRVALAARVAQLPVDPVARQQDRRIWVANELIRYGNDTTVRSAELAAAIAGRVLAAGAWPVRHTPAPTRSPS